MNSQEVSRGVQTWGVVRKTTVKTGKNQIPLLGSCSRSLKDISARLTASLTLIPGGGGPDSFPAPALRILETNCAPKNSRARGVQGAWQLTSLTGIPRSFSTQLPLHVSRRRIPTLQDRRWPRAPVPPIERRPTGKAFLLGVDRRCPSDPKRPDGG